MLGRLLVAAGIVALLMGLIVAGFAVFGGPWEWRKPWPETDQELWNDAEEPDDGYTALLIAFGEPSMLDESATSDRLSFRFVSVPAFGDPILVRVYLDNGVAWPRLVLKSLEQVEATQEQEDGRRQFYLNEKEFPITTVQFNRVAYLFRRMDPCSKDHPGMDGAQEGAKWVFEQAEPDRYCWVNLNAPDYGAYGELANYMIELSGYEPDKAF